MYTQTRNITNGDDRLSQTLFVRYHPKVRYTKLILVISSYFCIFSIKTRKERERDRERFLRILREREREQGFSEYMTIAMTIVIDSSFS